MTILEMTEYLRLPDPNDLANLSTVTFFSDTPFKEADYVTHVEVVGYWTNFQSLLFKGGSLEQALSVACIAKARIILGIRPYNLIGVGHVD